MVIVVSARINESAGRRLVEQRSRRLFLFDVFGLADSRWAFFTRIYKQNWFRREKCHGVSSALDPPVS